MPNLHQKLKLLLTCCCTFMIFLIFNQLFHQILHWALLIPVVVFLAEQKVYFLADFFVVCHVILFFPK